MQKFKAYGWIQTYRNRGGIAFLKLRYDSETDYGQIVVKDVELINNLKAVPRESYVEVTGTVLNEPVLDAFKIINACKTTLSHYGKKNTTGHGKLADYLKSNENAQLELKKSTILQNLRNAFNRENCLEFVPASLGNAQSAESGANVYKVVNNDEVYTLPQSPQLEKQLRTMLTPYNYYSIAKMYRAEPFNTARHAAEFTSVDMEVGTQSLAVLIEKCKNLICAAYTGLGTIEEKDFKQILYSEACKKLNVKQLNNSCELALCKLYNCKFLVITHYPVEDRPFYTYRNAENTTESFDIIHQNVGEICSGSLREFRLDFLESSPHFKKFNTYKDGFYSGPRPTGGFAIGFERLAMAILGVDSVHKINNYTNF